MAKVQVKHFTVMRTHKGSWVKLLVRVIEFALFFGLLIAVLVLFLGMGGS